MRFDAILVILTTLASPLAFGQAPDKLSELAHRLCREPLARADDLLKGYGAGPPDVALDVAGVKTVLALYHPSAQDAQGTLGVIASLGALPSRAELGTDADWDGVTVQTSALRAHAFGTPACRFPVARFARAGLKLSYVGVEHVFRDPSARDEVFAALRSEFEKSKPGAVVVEGYPERFPCGEAVRIFLTPEEKMANEPEYLAKLALARGARVYGGEPDGVGLQPPDEEGFQLLRQLTMHLGLPVRRAYQLAQREFPFGPGFSFAKFSAWYQRLNGRAFRLANAWSDITPTFSVKPGKPILGTNRLAEKVDLHRDSHVVQVVRLGLLTRGRVLVEYGRDHFPRQLPVFEKVFGQCATPVARCFSGAPSSPDADSTCP